MSVKFAVARPSDRKVAVLIEYRTFEGEIRYRKVFRNRAKAPVRRRTFTR